MVRRVVLLLAATLLALTACGGGSPPEVEFAAGDATVTARPAHYCDINLTECESDPTAPVTLPVPAGTTVRITVPEDVAKTPWTVVFSYRSSTGEQIDERSRVFSPNERSEFVLTLPSPTDQLSTAEVQQIGVPQVNPETGEVEYPVRASWVLTATP